MKKERGCGRNYWMSGGRTHRVSRGGGTATFTSPAGMIQPGTYPEIKVIDACSVARPGMIQMTPKGLMGGGRRRSNRRRSRSNRKRSNRRRAAKRGGGYQMMLQGQGMQPNQYADVVRIPGESCRVGQNGGSAAFLEVSPAGYGNKGELVTAEGGNVVPVLIQQPYNTTGAISSSCVKTGGRRRRTSKKSSRRSGRKSIRRRRSGRKSSKSRRNSRK
jgi:hypothetical protein